MAALEFWFPTAAIFIWAVNATLALTLVLSLALLLARYLKRDAVVRYWTLCIALLLGLLSPIAALLMPATGMSGLSLGWVQESGLKRGDASDQPIDAMINERRSFNPAHRGDLADPQSPPSASPKNERLGGSVAAKASSAPSERLVWPPAIDTLRTAISIVVLIWFTVAGGLLIRLLRGWRKVGSILREAKPVSDGSLGRIAAETVRLLGIARTPLVACSPRVTSPIVAGIWRPQVILPDGVVNQITESQIRDVLLHEMAHIVRRDLIVVLLQNVAAALFWPHPLLHRLNRSLARAREEICDNYVLPITDAPEFSHTLLRLAELIQLRGSLPLSVAMFTSQWRLESRVAGLLDENRRRITRLTRSGKAIVAFASIVLILVVACGSIALAQDRGGKQTAPSGNSASNASANAVSEKEPKAKSNDSNLSNRATDSPPPSKPTQPAKSALETYTSPISVSGRALDANGEPLSGATIYIASQRPGWKRLAEAKTDKAGKYQFADVPLPIERANTNTGHDNGVFIIYGQAKGRGFAWRSWKVYYPQRNGNSLVGTNLELPMEFMANDKIELDLHFSKSARFAGRVLTDRGDPIANAKLSIWDCERIAADGYGPEIAGSSRRPFAVFDTIGFELLSAGVPPEMQIRKTDANGRFEFSDVPADCRFRINIQPSGYPTREIFIATRTGLASDYDGIHLYDGAQEIDLRFAVPRSVRIRVVYSDTGEKAAKAYVDAANEGGSTWKSSDENGQVILSLPAGKYEMDAIPALGTPYLKTKGELEVKESAIAGDILATLRPAAQVEIRVVDASTGKGIPGVDLWSEERGYRDEHYSTSWEAATHIVHRDRKRTDDNGIIHALFEPGKQRLGVAWRSYPIEYEPGDSDGKVIDCAAGNKLTVTFDLHKASTTK